MAPTNVPNLHLLEGVGCCCQQLRDGHFLNCILASACATACLPLVAYFSSQLYPLESDNLNKLKGSDKACFSFTMQAMAFVSDPKSFHFCFIDQNRFVKNSICNVSTAPAGLSVSGFYSSAGGIGLTAC